MLSLVADLLFFCVLGIFGLTFEGSESSPVYKLFMAGNGGLVIALTIIGIMKGEIKTTISFWTLLILLPIFVLGCYFWQVPVYNLNMENARQFMLLMVCFSYTACCIGIYIAHQGIERHADLTLFIIRAGLFVRKRIYDLEDDVRNGKYKHMAIVLNGIKAGGRYGYRYGYKYGRYGHNYHHRKHKK